jgi:serine/threonine protein kinase
MSDADRARRRPLLEPEAGDTVSGYTLSSLIAVGGMGRVYRALAPGGEEVALKLVKASLAEDPVFRKRFERESRIAQRIEHPHVVAVLDAGEEHGIPFLVQQLMRGGSLAQQIEACTRLSVSEAVSMCRQVAEGLDAVHAAGLIHRDIKPANILLDDDGAYAITDFGLAKDMVGTVLTRPGQALGSVDYMAPEQIRGESVDAATDVYGLGCVTYECIAGSAPFAGRQGLSVLWAHLQDVARNPSDTRSDVPSELGRAVLRALEKEPSKRPPTATAFAEILSAAAGG